MIKAIIFDYDGVIMDSFGSVFEIYEQICQELNLPFNHDIESFRQAYGYNFKELQANLGIKEEDFKKSEEIFTNNIHLKEHKIFSGIPELLSELSDKYKLYLVTAGHEMEVHSKLKKFALDNYFQKIYCGSNLGMRKSEMFKELIAENNYTPQEVISIGDRQIDYDASKKADIPDANIILVTYGWGLAEDKVNQAHIVNNPAEIALCITSIS